MTGSTVHHTTTTLIGCQENWQLNVWIYCIVYTNLCTHRWHLQYVKLKVVKQHIIPSGNQSHKAHPASLVTVGTAFCATIRAMAWHEISKISLHFSSLLLLQMLPIISYDNNRYVLSLAIVNLLHMSRPLFLTVSSSKSLLCLVEFIRTPPHDPNLTTSF